MVDVFQAAGTLAYPARRTMNNLILIAFWMIAVLTADVYEMYE